MLVDYLRYVAFAGRLRDFFEKGVYEYVDPIATTGQHLRFSSEFLERRLGSRTQEIIHDLYWNAHSQEAVFERLRRDLGLTIDADSIVAPAVEIGGPPATFAYREMVPPELEVIIDVDPKHWAPRYSERRLFEETPVIYRRAGPARGRLSTGDKVFDLRAGRSLYGTLCGAFWTPRDGRLALTCGHVASPGSRVMVEQRRRLWKLPVGWRQRTLGATRYHAMVDRAGAMDNATRTQLDAALVAVDSHAAPPITAKVVTQATVKPISTILQEEPVRFRGGGRAAETLARVSAVTVRKSIDLFKDGQLHELGDVLMLGHRHPMYIAQRVSRPGDSGAAVRQDCSSVGPFAELNQWLGMILGSDEGGAFASYAEHLWAWAAHETGDPDIEFHFEL